MAAMDILSGQEGLYDNALMGILQSCGKLQPFLDAIFSFLSRRTDFYIIMQHPQAKMGFPPGVAEAMVQQAFKHYEILTRKREVEIMREEETRRLEHAPRKKKGKKGKSTAAPAPPSSITDELPISFPGSKESVDEPVGVADDEASTDRTAGSGDEEEEERAKEGGPNDKTSKSGEDGEGEGESDEEEIPPLEAVTEEVLEKRSAFNLSSDTYNGAELEHYKWSQTMTEVELRVPIAADTSPKQVTVEIRNDHLKVVLHHPEEKVVIDGSLLHRVKTEDSMWNIDRGSSCVYINLEKTKEMMWKSVLEGEEGIDLKQVDTRRDISEFDPDAQAAIQRVTYDHHMKMLGKPTSNEQKAHDILRKAWNAEGSPFKGTPFDPTRVHIAGQW